MKVVALISGGKDSCYNMMQCVRQGHEIVALANLKPKEKDELDSFMYQTVGHHAIDVYAEAMNVPLFRRTIEGSSVAQDRDYESTPCDEVEDLYQLLKNIQSNMDFEGVSVGAILSDYQRVRVENVCMRLGLTPLAYLWRRDQHELLKEMIDCGVEAVVIKVAALGLTPEKHLGKSLEQIYPHMLSMHQKYGLNVCGEGGEYETFTIDCPLFNKKIIIKEAETVIHSADAFAPVGYLHLKNIHTKEKNIDISLSHFDRIKDLPMYNGDGVISCLFSSLNCPSNKIQEQNSLHKCHQRSPHARVSSSITVCSQTGLMWTSSIEIRYDDTENWQPEEMTEATLEKLKELLVQHGLSFKNLIRVCLYVRDMKKYSFINNRYKKYFGLNPPCRICIETCLAEGIFLKISCVAYRESTEFDVRRNTMHVQGLSHWAPANIGPYSQAVMLGPLCYVAGMIALRPSDLEVISGGIAPQCHLSLHHVIVVLQAMNSDFTLNNIVSAICYVTHQDYIKTAQTEWKRLIPDDDDLVNCSVCPQFVNYAVVSGLPRGALVEWQVFAHKHKNWKVESCSNRSDRVKITASVAVQHEELPCTCIQAAAEMDAVSHDVTNVDAVTGIDKLLTACASCLEKLDCEWTGLTLLYMPNHTSELDLHKGFLDFFKSSVRPAPALTLLPVLQLSTPTGILTLCTS